MSAPAAAQDVHETYRLPAMGFSVVVPPGAKRVRDGDPATERGVRMVLPSGGGIVVFGEPNSLEYRTPAARIRGVRAMEANCSAGRVASVRVGRLDGAGARVLCGEQVIRYALAFRPGGGPIYWSRLDTTVAHESEGAKTFEAAKASFRIIRWE